MLNILDGNGRRHAWSLWWISSPCSPLLAPRAADVSVLPFGAEQGRKHCNALVYLGMLVDRSMMGVCKEWFFWTKVGYPKMTRTDFLECIWVDILLPRLAGPRQPEGLCGDVTDVGGSSGGWFGGPPNHPKLDYYWNPCFWGSTILRTHNWYQQLTRTA